MQDVSLTVTRIRQLVAEDTGRALSLGADERLREILAQHADMPATEPDGPPLPEPQTASPASEPAGEGRELPDSPGVWWRDGVWWTIEYLPDVGLHGGHRLARSGELAGRFLAEQLPRGSWRKSAPAASDGPFSAFGACLLPYNETGTARVWPDGKLGCHDCGERYGSPRFPDLIIDDSVWLVISPNHDEGGLLCPSCICGRLEVAGLQNVGSKFTSGALAAPAASGERQREWDILKPVIDAFGGWQLGDEEYQLDGAEDVEDGELPRIVAKNVKHLSDQWKAIKAIVAPTAEGQLFLNELVSAELTALREQLAEARLEHLQFLAANSKVTERCAAEIAEIREQLAEAQHMRNKYSSVLTAANNLSRQRKQERDALRARLAEVGGERDNLVGVAKEYDDEVRRLREALACLEWSRTSYCHTTEMFYALCPVCHGRRPHHNEDCSVRATLASQPAPRTIIEGEIDG